MAVLAPVAEWGFNTGFDARRESLRDIFGLLDGADTNADSAAVLLNDVAAPAAPALWFDAPPVLPDGPGAIDAVPASPTAEPMGGHGDECIVPELDDLGALAADHDLPDMGHLLGVPAMLKPRSRRNSICAPAAVNAMPAPAVNAMPAPTSPVVPAPVVPAPVARKRKPAASKPKTASKPKAAAKRSTAGKGGRKAPATSRAGSSGRRPKTDASVRARKRDGNRRAAKKFRMKQKAHEQALLDSVDALEATNAAMARELSLILQIIGERR